jgi:signal transduction histidine kinase
MATISIFKRPFAWALAMLIVSAAFCGYTIYRLQTSERWIHHTYEVQLAIAAIERNLTKAGRARSAYVESGDSAGLRDFRDARSDLQKEFTVLRGLLADNAQQAARCDDLRSAAENRLALLQRSIELQQSGHSDLVAQAALSTALVRWAFATAATADAMQQAEDSLLQQRSSLTANLFGLTIAAVLVTLVLSAALFWVNDRMLGRQLHQRQAAEHNAQLLSTALMRIQDEERRKFSRELHDSLGQTLAAGKMLADSVAAKFPEEQTLARLCLLLHEALKETRTLSQLLHPPLLDEVGLLSAAHWFMDEFSQRTGVNVDFHHDVNFPELPKSVELTLFRILQEALTNVHRHAQTAEARVELSLRDKRVKLLIRDNGAGIPEEKLSRFQSDGSGVGVGLAGMRNRVREQGGTLSVDSDNQGTIIAAELPTDYALNSQAAAQRNAARATA